MTTVKTAISIQDSLYVRAESLANEMKISRSKLFTLAIEEYLRQHRNQQLLQSLNEAYGDGLDQSEESMLHGMRRHQRRLLEKNHD
jgi:metal-responsive CopG/Arc/MetJ family transcriptional regulator